MYSKRADRGQEKLSGDLFRFGALGVSPSLVWFCDQIVLLVLFKIDGEDHAVNYFVVLEEGQQMSCELSILLCKGSLTRTSACHQVGRRIEYKIGVTNHLLHCLPLVEKELRLIKNLTGYSTSTSSKV